MKRKNLSSNKILHYFSKRGEMQILTSLSPKVKSVLQDRVSDVMRSQELESNWGHLSYPDDSQQLLDQERNEYSLFYYRMKDSKSGEDNYDRVSVFF